MPLIGDLAIRDIQHSPTALLEFQSPSFCLPLAKICYFSLFLEPSLSYFCVYPDTKGAAISEYKRA